MILSDDLLLSVELATLNRGWTLFTWRKLKCINLVIRREALLHRLVMVLRTSLPSYARGTLVFPAVSSNFEGDTINDLEDFSFVQTNCCCLHLNVGDRLILILQKGRNKSADGEPLGLQQSLCWDEAVETFHRCEVLDQELK